MSRSSSLPTSRVWSLKSKALKTGLIDSISLCTCQIAASRLRADACGRRRHTSRSDRLGSTHRATQARLQWRSARSLKHVHSTACRARDRRVGQGLMCGCLEGRCRSEAVKRVEVLCGEEGLAVVCDADTQAVLRCRAMISNQACKQTMRSAFICTHPLCRATHRIVHMLSVPWGSSMQAVWPLHHLDMLLC